MKNIVNILFISLIAVLAVAILSGVASADSVTGTIDVSAFPVGMALTPDGNFLYVANFGNGSVSKISTATNAVVATISVGTDPIECAVTPNGTLVFVSNYHSNNVSIISVASNAVVGTRNVGINPRQICFTTNSLYAYVMNSGGGNITKLSTTNTSSTAINVGAGPNNCVMNSAGTILYVSNMVSGNISLVGVTNNTLFASISNVPNATGLSLSTNGSLLYANCVANNTVKVFRVSDRSLRATIPVGAFPYNSMASPDGKYIYVPCFNAGAASNVSKISTTTSAVVQYIDVGDGPTGVAISSNSGTIYTSCIYSDRIYVITRSSSVSAAFTADATIGVVPFDVQFTDQSTGLSLTYQWSFGDGTANSTVQNPLHTYNDSGSFNVTLTITNGDETAGLKKTAYISAYGPIVVAFTANVTTGTAPLAVGFTDASSGCPISWFWLFGDGSSSESQNPVHQYTTAGVYTVSLSASNLFYGDSGAKAGYIIVVAASTPTPAPTPTPNPTNATAYAWLITGGIANKSATIAPFADHYFTDVMNKTIATNDTDDVDPAGAVYTITKPFYLYGVGSWWIVIVLLTMGAIFMFDHHGSPFLVIILLMIGNAVLWVFIPFDIMATVTVCSIFSLSLMIVSALKGRAP